jgi:hypothetical protein
MIALNIQLVITSAFSEFEASSLTDYRVRNLAFTVTMSLCTDCVVNYTGIRYEV